MKAGTKNGIVKRVLAWVLALALTLGNVDYVSAAAWVNEIAEGVESNSSQFSERGTEDGTDDGEDETVEDTEGILHKGEVDGIIWEITSDGVLTIRGIYTGETDKGVKSSPWHEYKDEIRSAVVTVKNVKSTYNWFRDCTNLTYINLDNFDTSQVTSMDYMFSGCSGLKSLDLSGFNTSKLISMYGMFAGCSSLSSLDISSFDTTSVTGISYLFQGCSSLVDLDLRHFNTSKIRNFDCMFDGCSGSVK